MGDDSRDSLLHPGSGDGVDLNTSDSKSDRIMVAKLMRATFYILSKQQDQAFADLGDVIENENADCKIRANALIKRASLYIQSFKDFERATEIDPNNADVSHHRGQVHLLTEQI